MSSRLDQWVVSPARGETAISASAGRRFRAAVYAVLLIVTLVIVTPLIFGL